jgi:methylmalonyl-CoA mutase, C-terminal domain
MAKGRILIGKPGLDGHDRGARYIVRVLRDAGYEVIYTGIRRSPEQIVETAIQEHVDAIGLSLLSGAHRVLFRRVLDLLEEHGAGDIMVFGGGTIPEDDIPDLEAIGVQAIFTPGTPAEEILSTIERLFSRRPVDRSGGGSIACQIGRDEDHSAQKR